MVVTPDAAAIRAERVESALHRATAPIPSMKGMDPRARAQFLHAELERRIADAKEALECPAVPSPTPDLVAELVSLRAWVLHMAALLDEAAELPSSQRTAAIWRLTERMRHEVMTPRLMEACRRD